MIWLEHVRDEPVTGWRLWIWMPFGRSLTISKGKRNDHH